MLLNNSNVLGGGVTANVIGGGGWFMDGTAAAPSISFLSDPDTGIYRVGANDIGLAAAGAVVARVNATHLFGGENVTGGFQMPKGAGAVGAPVYSFGGDTDTGMYRFGADSFGFAAGGSLIAYGTTTYIIGGADNTGVFALNRAVGAVGSPSYSFKDDPDTGAYRVGANNYGIAVGGVKAIDVSAAAMTVGGQANGQLFAIETLTELTTIAAAATTDTTIQIPANSVVLGVSVRVTVVIPTAADFDYGVAGATDRYGDDVLVAADTTNPGTKDGTRFYAAATAIRFTPDATPADDSGRVRTTIWFYRITPATS